MITSDNHSGHLEENQAAKNPTPASPLSAELMEHPKLRPQGWLARAVTNQESAPAPAGLSSIGLMIELLEGWREDPQLLELLGTSSPIISLPGMNEVARQPLNPVVIERLLMSPWVVSIQEDRPLHPLGDESDGPDKNESASDLEKPL